MQVSSKKATFTEGTHGFYGIITCKLELGMRGPIRKPQDSPNEKEELV